MMNRLRLIAVVGLALVAGLGSNGWCAEEKIAIIDMAKVMRAHPRTSTNRAILEKEIAEFEAERAKMMKKLQEMKEDFDKTRKEAGNKALSDKARAKNLALAEEKLAAIREYQRDARETAGLRQKQITDHRMRMGKRVLSEVREVIEEYAKKEKIAVVLDSAGIAASGVEVVVYSSGKLDITDDIVKVVEKKE